jgi:hypothetical protein
MASIDLHTQMKLINILERGVVDSGRPEKAHALAQALVRAGDRARMRDPHIHASFFSTVYNLDAERRSRVGASMAAAYLRGLLAPPCDAQRQERMCTIAIDNLLWRDPKVLAASMTAAHACVDEEVFKRLLVDGDFWDRMRNADLGEFRGPFQAAYEAMAPALAARAAAAAAR